jgi:hypothetical protein
MALYKVTGLAHDGLKIVRMPPRYFKESMAGTALAKATIHLHMNMERGFVWRQNPKGSRNEWSVVGAKKMKWPKGARE